MLKTLFLFFTLICVILVSGCNTLSALFPSDPDLIEDATQSEPTTTFNLPEGIISEYLPITLNDQFELSSHWRRHYYPHIKTQFTDTELMVIYRAISSFRFYGNNHPWAQEFYVGGAPLLNAVSEEHNITILLIKSANWGTISLAIIDNDPETQMWFEMDSDAYDDIIGLIPHWSTQG